MPVSNAIANGYLQLGVAGAALLIVLVTTLLNQSQNKSIINSSDKKVDKLCDKIDTLVTALTKEMIVNDKDQKETINKLDTILDIAVENQRRISRIDDRTFQCLGNPNKKGEENNVTND